MSNDKNLHLSAVHNRAAARTSVGETSVPSRNVKLSAPLITDDTGLIARRRIDTVHHRNAILGSLKNG